MAEEETKDEEVTEAEAPKSSKKGLLLGGGALALVAIAGIGAMLAVPGSDKHPSFDGPFVMNLAGETESLTVNLAGEGARRFLVMDLKVEFDAYEEAYGIARTADTLYLAKLQDAMLTIASQKTADEVLEIGTQGIFIEQIASKVEPLLFPVHIGKTEDPMMRDEPSKLRPGISIFESTMRDPLHDQAIKIDAPNKTLQLSDGEVYAFDGSETNLMLKDGSGRTVFVDVTGIDDTFVGEIPVGIKGSVRSLYKVKFIIQ